MNDRDFGPLWERAQALARTGFYANSSAVLAALHFDHGRPDVHGGLGHPAALDALDALCRQGQAGPSHDSDRLARRSPAPD